MRKSLKIALLSFLGLSGLRNEVSGNEFPAINDGLIHVKLPKPSVSNRYPFVPPVICTLPILAFNEVALTSILLQLKLPNPSVINVCPLLPPLILTN